MSQERSTTVRAVLENAYVRAAFGSATVAGSQREVVIKRFAQDIENDVAVLEAIISHEAAARTVVTAADEPVLTIGDL